MAIPEVAATIDRERHLIELKGIRAAAFITSRARRAVIAAAKQNRNVVAALRSALYGSGVDEPTFAGRGGIIPLMIDCMTLAHMVGIRRTELIAAPHFRMNQKLAGTVYDDALDFMRQRLNLTSAELEAVKQEYQADALKVVETAGTSLERRLQATLIQTTAEGKSVPEGVQELRRAFEDEGMAPEENYRLEAIFRTQTQTAYSAGRESSMRDPAIQEILWGFEYIAIEDDRTTQLCRSLDGMKRPKDDPIWARFTPPNHWNCRSTKIELYYGDRRANPTDIPDGLVPYPGFGFNPGDVFGGTLRRAA